ncbi:MAG TPA: helicase-exonuclease AddAB subunit AddA [Candidatus Mediterraneibacter gallistercoris]|uniref:ATP-dependent helicase/nuclease subunit A n=1 Tax=Candidatus Mediterraneibacter gallistercoris TaxID=2838671 RepID=A0A9D2P4I8_9FIRM|nr:helicase-exonuclease AddAB subunit AddA [Candidatus Mediterraneibacter gallistercoris]
MSVKWTSEQQKVIDLRNRNILVSAAAGSGKTAVLVERIIRRLTEDDTPTDVDRLLIVTFTEAAAAEMKERIGAAIEKKLEERPGDIRLERQATLIHSAQITTIHSFCLAVIRDHFHVIGIDPGFRIAEEGELKLLKQDVLEELLEECYAEAKEEFLDFTERFGSGKSDKKIEEIILKMYEYSRSYPRPDRWLDQCVKAYESENLEVRAEERVRMRAADIERVLERGLKICEEPDGPYMYGDMLDSDLEELERLQRAENFDAMYSAAAGFKWKRLSSKKDDTVSPDKKEKVKKLREQAKSLLKGMQEDYFYAPREVWQQDMQDALPSVVTLTELVKRFAHMLDEKKRLRNMIDFNDMEQFALAILTEEKDGELVPSAVAGEYEDRFDEVMIDEYQDSNLVQETILTSVSRVSRGEYNIFMVGDVKQSIYSFRLSRPELFMEKYNTYSLKDSVTQRIDLHKNFRSREEVLDSVNDIFRQIMKKELGGIEYDDSAALYPGAEFPPLPSGKEDFCKSELLLLDKEDTGGEDERQAEARMIARRIRELIRDGVVLDKETREYRRVQYRDIVILTRSIRGWAEVFSSVLGEEGIPAYSVSREGYFETYEVSVLLDYLKILDNARQDLPLAAVLTSVFGGLDTRELAEIRIAYPNVPFYEAAAMCAESDAAEDACMEELRGKLRRFYDQVRYFREKVPYTPIHELLEEIIDKTGYGLYIAAMPGGAQRMANVEMLTERAAAFEGTSYKGLFNFVRYIAQLKKYDVDYGEAGIMDEQADTVRIMSIHKSKGLEFPIVFVAGMGKKFNTQDTKGSVLLHPDWGAGVDLIDLKRRTKTPTFLKKMIREETALENLAEEMRILYVALTRAKEKLIMTGAAKITEDGAVSDISGVFRAEGAKCYLDWVLPCILSDETGKVKQESPVEVSVFRAEDLTPQQEEVQAEVMSEDVLRNWDDSQVYEPELRERLDAQIDYVYPFEDEGKMKLKFTVSELKKWASLAEEAGEEMYEEPVVVPLIPEFLKEEEILTGAPRGSAYHKLLELLDFTVDYDVENLIAAVQQLRQEGRLTDEMAECIRPKDILRFLGCRSGKRMADAARNGKLYKEQPFVLSVDASEIYPEDCSGEKILVQGIIDVYFEEPDGLVVLDYKTDKVRTGNELKEKYHAQLDYYAQALEQLTEKPVKEKIIYSFTLGEEIEV